MRQYLIIFKRSLRGILTPKYTLFYFEKGNVIRRNHVFKQDQSPLFLISPKNAFAKQFIEKQLPQEFFGEGFVTFTAYKKSIISPLAMYGRKSYKILLKTYRVPLRSPHSITSIALSILNADCFLASLTRLPVPSIHR